MPTYDYACTHCDHAFEVVQSFTDDALTECPQCGGRLRKVFGSVGVVFKGSGFYRTDSRSSSSLPAGKSESKSESKAESTSGASPSGATFQGGVQLADALAKDPSFAACVTKKLTTFTLGRLMNQADDPQWISYLSWKAAQSKAASLPALIRTVILSDAFRSRTAL